MNLDRPTVAAAAPIAPVFMKKKESVEKYAEAILEARKRGVELLDPYQRKGAKSRSRKTL